MPDPCPALRLCEDPSPGKTSSAAFTNRDPARGIMSDAFCLKIYKLAFSPPGKQRREALGRNQKLLHTALLFSNHYWSFSKCRAWGGGAEANKPPGVHSLTGEMTSSRSQSRST